MVSATPESANFRSRSPCLLSLLVLSSTFRPPSKFACASNYARRAGGGWLTLHILLLLAQQRSPPEFARWLFCSRSSVYAAAYAWQSGRRPWETGPDAASPLLPAGLTPTRQCSLLALLNKVPSVYG